MCVSWMGIGGAEKDSFSLGKQHVRVVMRVSRSAGGELPFILRVLEPVRWGHIFPNKKRQT